MGQTAQASLFSDTDYSVHEPWPRLKLRVVYENERKSRPEIQKREIKPKHEDLAA